MVKLRYSKHQGQNQMRQYKTLLLSVILALIAIIPSAYAGMIVEIPPPTIPDSSLEATKTLLWEAQNPKATLIFIPGSSGRLALRQDQTNITNPFYQMLRHLAETKSGDEKINVVIFDSPWSLGDVSYPAARTANNHIKRIEDVVVFYKKKFGLPVWIMGHSNGGVSADAFLKYLQNSGNTAEIQGAIFSNSNNAIDFKAPIDVPILFVQHEFDSCPDTTASRNTSTYKKLLEINRANTQLSLISTGGSAGDCKSGAHMFSGSEGDVKTAIKKFILSNNKKH